MTMVRFKATFPVNQQDIMYKRSSCATVANLDQTWRIIVNNTNKLFRQGVKCWQKFLYMASDMQKKLESSDTSAIEIDI